MITSFIKEKILLLPPTVRGTVRRYRYTVQYMMSTRYQYLLGHTDPVDAYPGLACRIQKSGCDSAPSGTESGLAGALGLRNKKETRSDLEK
jgi:hypothetical protein